MNAPHALKGWLPAAAAMAAVAGLAAGLAAHAAPARIDIDIDAGEFFYDPEAFDVVPSEAVEVTMTNIGLARHDIVFELDGGRVERIDPIGLGRSETLTFDAPAAPGAYVYYCSVGNHRGLGMEGTMTVLGTPEPTAPATAEPTEPPPPGAHEVVADALANPHGLALDGGTLLVGEAGTGEPAPGSFAPGNADGAALAIDLADPGRRTVIVDGVTNAQDPGGGVVGVNHVIRWPQGTVATGTARVTLVAVAGGPGHARPDEAAKILSVDEAGDITELADVLAYEAANNPGGEDPEQGGIDANPWRLVPEGDHVYIVDAGANAVFRMDPADGALSTYAVFEPVGEDGGVQAVPSGMVFDPDGGGTALVTLLGSIAPGAGQIRMLEDNNGDGDALDEGENELLLDGLTMPSDIAVHREVGIVFSEIMSATVSALDLSLGGLIDPIFCWIVQCPEPDRAAGAQPFARRVPLEGGLYGASGLAFEPDGDLLVSVNASPGQGRPTFNSDRVVRVSRDALVPEPIPTAPPPTDTPPPTATAPPERTATPPVGPPEIYLPRLVREM